MATEKVLVGKLNIIIDNLSSDTADEGSLASIKSDMVQEAGYDEYTEVTENMQYVQGKYNITYAYYETITTSTTPENNS